MMHRIQRKSTRTVVTSSVPIGSAPHISSKDVMVKLSFNAGELLFTIALTPYKLKPTTHTAMIKKNSGATKVSGLLLSEINPAANQELNNSETVPVMMTFIIIMIMI